MSNINNIVSEKSIEVKFDISPRVNDGVLKKPITIKKRLTLSEISFLLSAYGLEIDGIACEAFDEENANKVFHVEKDGKIHVTLSLYEMGGNGTEPENYDEVSE